MRTKFIDTSNKNYPYVCPHCGSLEVTTHYVADIWDDMTVADKVQQYNDNGWERLVPVYGVTCDDCSKKSVLPESAEMLREGFARMIGTIDRYIYEGGVKHSATHPTQVRGRFDATYKVVDGRAVVERDPLNEYVYCLVCESPVGKEEGD